MPRAICIVLLACTACAVHKPQTYRLDRQGTVLIPPGVATSDLAKRTFTADVAPGGGPCAPGGKGVALRARKGRLQVTVHRAELEKQPPSGLTAWTSSLESQGCLAPGAGMKLAERIAESLPLRSGTPFRLLYAGQSDINPRVRIQVVSPILREGARPAVTINSSADLIGYETAWYAVEARPKGGGFTISPLYAERRIGPATDRRPQPATNYFPFPPDAAFYRLFFKAEESEFTALVIAARTPAELERRFAVLEAGPASCQRLNGELCIAIPKLVAVNPCLDVTVNGSQIQVRLGATVGEAIRTAGERRPDAVLQELAIFKLYNGRLARVEFDRASPAILNLVLIGGETISWR